MLSAYACEPGKGSEPGVGWRWANGLAERVDLRVLTRESNRAVIEAEVAALPSGHPLASVEFFYHDLSAPFLAAKRRGWLPTLVYYAFWQYSISKKFATEADSADVVHHLTFCTLLCPGFWKLKRAVYVLGPVGAPKVNPHYLPLFGNHAWKQRLRARVLTRFLSLPWLRRLLHGAAAIVPANSETRDTLIAGGINAREVMLDTGTPAIPEKKLRRATHGAIRLMYAGQLERRKGLELALRALEMADCDWSFDIYGSGPDKRRLEQIADELSISDRVDFHGVLPRVELMKRFDDADAFLFTSVRDTSGGVNLEAMAHGLPVICIAHQGVGDITDESCAERITPGPIPDTIQQISAAVTRLAADPERRLRMGQAAAKRAETDFCWEAKFDRMTDYYHEAINKSS